MILDGNLFQIGTTNDNGWSVPESEVSNVLRKLTGIPLKKCSGGNDDPHHCDYLWSNKAIIGRITGARRNGNWVKASAEVSDENAIANIKSGEFPAGWSLFTGYVDKAKSGELTGVKPLAVTLCDNPAYSGAGYVSSGIENKKVSYLSVLQSIESQIKREAAAAEAKGKMRIEEQAWTDLEKYYLKSQNPQQQRQNPADGLKAALFKLEHKCMPK